jgi:hypothetical protein
MICLILLISSCQTVIIQLKETKKYDFKELKDKDCIEIIKVYVQQLNEIMSDYEDLKSQIKTADGYKIVIVE